MINKQQIARTELCIEQMVKILEPFARAVKCLESTQSTVADVYLFWLAVVATLHDYFCNNANADGLQLPEEVIDDIRQIVNHRWREMTEKAGKGVYVAGLFLDPRTFTFGGLNDVILNLLLQIMSTRPSFSQYNTTRSISMSRSARIAPPQTSPPRRMTKISVNPFRYTSQLEFISCPSSRRRSLQTRNPASLTHTRMVQQY